MFERWLIFVWVHFACSRPQYCNTPPCRHVRARGGFSYRGECAVVHRDREKLLGSIQPDTQLIFVGTIRHDDWPFDPAGAIYPIRADQTDPPTNNQPHGTYDTGVIYFVFFSHPI